MKPDLEGFLRPQIDNDKCVSCHLCERACPVLHPSVNDSVPECYAARTKDRNLLLASSSGGIFTELASQIFSEGGAVFGCILDESLIAVHSKAENMKELARMRGSKYVQSDLGNTFREVRYAIEDGRKVLFSGTPCQVAGIKQFLGTPSDNLITVELICHGTPSPAVFENYIKEFEKESGMQLLNISFRDKHNSWKNASLLCRYIDGSERRRVLYEDPYVRAFLNNLCLRPSCYQCSAKEGRSGADITIADFWGIENFFPEMDDDLGTSAVIVHSISGKVLWEKCRNNCETFPCTLADIVANNASYHSSYQQPRYRQYFMRNFTRRPLRKLTLKCLRGPWPLWMLRRMIRKIKRVVCFQ